MTTIKKLYLHKIITSVIGCMFVIYSTNAANVSARGAQRATQTAARANIQKSTAKTPATDTTTTATTAKTESEPKITIKNKSSQFDDTLSEIKEIEDISIDQDLAAKIKQQRDAFNTESTKETTATKFETALTTKKNDCDQKLRACMKSK
jgi:hemolysin activation/secretion protein